MGQFQGRNSIVTGLGETYGVDWYKAEEFVNRVMEADGRTIAQWL
jgi:hypothetical protein